MFRSLHPSQDKPQKVIEPWVSIFYKVYAVYERYIFINKTGKNEGFCQNSQILQILNPFNAVERC